MKRATRSPEPSLAYLSEALQGSEEKYRLVSEAVPLFVSLLYPDGKIEYVDRHWHEYTGLSWQQTVERGWASLVHEEDRPVVMDRWRRALEVGQPFELEFRVRRAADGAERWHSGRCFPIRDSEGQIIRWIAGCVDIHDQRMAAQAARESQALFQTLGEALPAFLWISDAEGKPIYQNPAWTAYTGLSQAELSIVGWSALAHPDDLPGIRDLWAEANRTGEPMEFEFRCRRHDGVYRWFLARFVPLKDDDGRITRWVGTVTDIHERREAEEELRRSEERFRQMAEAVPSIFWTAAPDGTITYANPQWLEYTGLTP
ncbi:MAG: PAS domain S-box protein, partial [Acidobacteria bacterium]|nr:PAS domain S-box protein [Acidobacteriota bacterium]